MKKHDQIKWKNDCVLQSALEKYFPNSVPWLTEVWELFCWIYILYYQRWFTQILGSHSFFTFLKVLDHKCLKLYEAPPYKNKCHYTDDLLSINEVIFGDSLVFELSVTYLCNWNLSKALFCMRKSHVNTINASIFWKITMNTSISSMKICTDEMRKLIVGCITAVDGVFEVTLGIRVFNFEEYSKMF